MSLDQRMKRIERVVEDEEMVMGDDYSALSDEELEYICSTFNESATNPRTIELLKKVERKLLPKSKVNDFSKYTTAELEAELKKLEDKQKVG